MYIKAKFLFLLLSLLVFCSYSQENVRKNNAEIIKSEYSINQKIVSKKEYENFKNTLHEIEKTYQCIMHEDGAANSYVAKDKNSNKYIVEYYLTAKEEKYSISKN